MLVFRRARARQGFTGNRGPNSHHPQHHDRFIVEAVALALEAAYVGEDAFGEAWACVYVHFVHTMMDGFPVGP